MCPHFSRIVKQNLGSAPITYQKFLSCFESMGKPVEPVPAPTSLPKTCRLNQEFFLEPEHSVPTLKDLGVDESQLGECLYPGGETSALTRLEKSLENKFYFFSYIWLKNIKLIYLRIAWFCEQPHSPMGGWGNLQ